MCPGHLWSRPVWGLRCSEPGLSLSWNNQAQSPMNPVTHTHRPTTTTTTLKGDLLSSGVDSHRVYLPEWEPWSVVMTKVMLSF